MNVNVNSTQGFTVYGKTRIGNRVPVPAGVVPSISILHAASSTFDPATNKGTFVAPSSAGTDNFSVSNGSLTPYAVGISYVLDPNEVVAFDVSFP